ncbi:serine protease [Thermomonas brevis]
MNKSLLGLSIAACLTFGSAQAANIVLQNQDPAGVGLNDTTPASPVGKNPGKTRGEQARIVYQYAVDLWGGVLESPQTIYVAASFAPLACTATGGTLASAGTTVVFNDGERAYGSALTDALFDIDAIEYFYGLSEYPDITSRFNGAMGSPGCLEGMSWYFGLDGKTPDGQVNFLNVVMHEIGHGLGVQGFTNRTVSSAAFGTDSYGVIDAYTANAYDNVLNQPFSNLTAPGARRAALLTPGRTVWTGANVNRNAKLILSKRLALTGSAPVALAGKQYEIGFAAFGNLATAGAFSGKAFALVNDGNGAATDGCSAAGAATGPNDTIVYANKAEVAGKVAVIDRGTCSFEYKAKIAQDNGAVGVVIVNNAAGVIDMGRGAAPTTGLTIPSVMISQADGAQLKANIATARAAVQVSNLLAGADSANRARLYTPATYAAGSSYSHFDTTATPNALMEPFDDPSVQAHVNVDMTPGLFKDIGWTLNPGNGMVNKCDTGAPAVADGGFIIGANLQAQHTVCAYQFPTNKLQYTKCMTDHGIALRNQALLNGTQHMKLVQCASRR